MTQTSRAGRQHTAPHPQPLAIPGRGRTSSSVPEFPARPSQQHLCSAAAVCRAVQKRSLLGGLSGCTKGLQKSDLRYSFKGEQTPPGWGGHGKREATPTSVPKTRLNFCNRVQSGLPCQRGICNGVQNSGYTGNIKNMGCPHPHKSELGNGTHGAGPLRFALHCNSFANNL